MEPLKKFWIELIKSGGAESEWWKRKKDLLARRDVSVVRVNGRGYIFHRIRYDQSEKIYYQLHLSMLLKQGDYFYLEEEIVPYQFRWEDGKIEEHRPVEVSWSNEPYEKLELENEQSDRAMRFSYDRLAAVQYAERWWNSYNPAYRTFEVDCTNYVSQCLRAGGAPMRGTPNRNQGWWYQQDNWSYSWAVAHSLRWFLSGSTHGLKGTEVDSPEELSLGDIICYDFEGDGRWNHNTIVVAKDIDGMPLVNAHTQNSRLRYWSYEDSSAWTPNIAYKFFRIGE
ncbi:amidase domain-containing protein [Ornithinibacillus contaminans]|uniref:amidase domain-containing protein n=1 Tax=Ornithinibacillus contaminans TaxID=694055 RepID=UPI00064DF402|nr:amidase domain-containing protein [Ornithinibacillus contaminans]